jgi:hypothetical protein
MDAKSTGMETFHCVNAEFYADGKVLACMTSKKTNRKPTNQFRQVPEMSAFKIWLVNADTASRLLESIKNGEFGMDDVLCFYSGISEQQRAA